VSSQPAQRHRLDSLRSMLHARSIAVVGASARTGSFGHRLTSEVLASPAGPDVHLVNPRGGEVRGLRCVPSLTDVPAPVDLVLLGVPDSAAASQLRLAADRGDAGAVVFGTAPGQGETLRKIATDAGMALIGGGCMGFVNVQRGVRAVGYQERDEIPAGPVALVSHSGSAFSALLRTHRPLGFTIAVSSGQELVTTTADLLDHVLDLDETRVVALVLETLRDAPGMRAALARAEAADVPVVALTVGGSPTGRALVGAHSGAVAGDDAAWEALCDAHGMHRVGDLDELVNTLELFAVGRRAAPTPTPAQPTGAVHGIATVHDSGAERAHAADLAYELGVPFAAIGEQTRARLQSWLDPGLVADNPLDVWGRGADTERLFADCLLTMSEDPAVAAVAFAVDLVEECDGDLSFPRAAASVHTATTKPVVVLSNIAAAVDRGQADWLRARGVPVLEGTRGGLRALGHLLAQAERRHREPQAAVACDPARQQRWRDVLAAGPLDLPTSLALLTDYAIEVAPTRSVRSVSEAVRAATELGLPVVLKCDDHAVLHRTERCGVAVGLADTDAVAAAYLDLSARLGPSVVVQPAVPALAELALGVVRDPLLGPLVVVAAGGVQMELAADRTVALPPIDEAGAARLVDRLRVRPVLDGFRGARPADLGTVLRAVVGVSTLAVELGDCVEAIDINPLRVGTVGAVAVDALVLPRELSP